MVGNEWGLCIVGLRVRGKIRSAEGTGGYKIKDNDGKEKEGGAIVAINSKMRRRFDGGGLFRDEKK